MANPFTRQPPKVDIRQIGPVTRFSSRWEGTLIYPSRIDHNPVGSVMALPLPGQKNLPGPSLTEFPDTDGPNYFVIKQVHVFVFVSDYWVQLDEPAGGELKALGIDLGITDITRAGASVPEFRLIDKVWPPTKKASQLIQTRAPRLPVYNWIAARWDNNDRPSHGQQNPVVKPWAPVLLNNTQVAPGNPAGSIEAHEPHHNDMSLVLSPLDWFSFVRTGGIIASKTEDEITVNSNSIGNRIYIAGYFSPRYSDLIPYI